jgi:hypothetical protein
MAAQLKLSIARFRVKPLLRTSSRPGRIWLEAPETDEGPKAHTFPPRSLFEKGVTNGEKACRWCQRGDEIEIAPLIEDCAD